MLFALFWAALGGAGAASALVEGKTVLAGLPTVTENDKPFVLAASGGAILLALLLLATARRRSSRKAATRRTRPLRLVLGTIAGVGGGMALATSELSLDPALMAGGLTGGGALSLVISFWSFLTSKRRVTREATVAPDGAPRTTIALEPDLVAKQLRGDGWFVVEGMHLQMSYADYVAVGAAGVLAIQTFWTDVADDGNAARTRARVAAGRLRDVLQRHEVDVDVIPVVLVCGPLPDEITEAVAVVDNVAVLVARRSEQWRAELRQSNALGVERFEIVRDLLSTIDPAELTPV